jgi:hypothetical protein
MCPCFMGSIMCFGVKSTAIGIRKAISINGKLNSHIQWMKITQYRKIYKKIVEDIYYIYIRIFEISHFFYMS